MTTRHIIIEVPRRVTQAEKVDTLLRGRLKPTLGGYSHYLSDLQCRKRGKDIRN